MGTEKSEKDALQKNIDIVFTNAIQDSMKGLSNDYDKIKPTKKPQPLKLGVEAEPDFELDTELELRNFS